MQLALILLFLQLWWNVDSLSQNACPKLPDVPHAFVTDESRRDEYEFGDVVYFTCETGYTSGPNIKHVCSKEGWLVVRDGTCRLKQCELPDDIPNGYYQIIHGEDFVFGTTIKYFCNEGYQMMSRADTRTCSLNKWTNRVPSCEPLSCESPPEGLTVKGLPEQGEPILPDRFIEIICPPGKRANGSSVLICGKHGQWDNPFPTCEEIACKVGVMHPHLHAGGLTPETTTVRAGHTLQFYCDDEYTIDGPEEIHCSETGQWSSPFPTCSDKCSITAIPESVRITTRNVRGNKVNKGQKLRFVCRTHGHFVHGNEMVECLANGQWSDAFPTCGPPSSCGKPPPLADGDTKSTTKYTYRHNDQVEYICQNLYTMEGEPYKTCENGEWIGNMRCIRACTVDREDMAKHNIVLAHRYDDKLYSTHGDYIEFICKRGTRRVGTLQMRQQCIDGVIQLPTCQ